MRSERRFPWQGLARVARADLAPLRAAARALPPDAPGRAARAVEELLGAPVAIAPLPIERLTAGELGQRLIDPIVAIVLESTGSLCARIAIELDPRLALVVVDRALGGRGGDHVTVPTTGLSEIERGVLAYVAARALSTATTPRHAVAGVVTSRIALAAALDGGGATIWPARATIGDDAGVVRAILTDRAIETIDAPRASIPPGLLTLPVELSVEGSWGTLPARELAALRNGDVVLLDQTTVRRVAGAVEGTVRVRTSAGRGATWVCEIRSGTLTLASIERAEGAVNAIAVDRREPEPVTARGGRRMDDADTERQVLERAGDFPVEVAVEIARFSMPLAELSALRPGEVLATGTALGERVSLRSGGRIVAEGELVEVDGEVGVRVISIG